MLKGRAEITRVKLRKQSKPYSKSDAITFAKAVNSAARPIEIPQKEFRNPAKDQKE